MKIKKGIILIIIGAVALGIMTSCVSADEPVIIEESVEVNSDTIILDTTNEIDLDEIHPDMDTTIGIDTTEEEPWEDQPFWDDPGVAEGDVIIAPNPNAEEKIILYESANGDYKTESQGATILGIIAGIISSIFILLICRGY
jgi:hypothetical protein